MSRIDTLPDTVAGIHTRWLDLFRGGRGPRLIAFLLAVWLHASNSMLVVTTLPSAVAEIGGDAYVGWAFTLYLLASILVGVVTGLLVMRMGLRRSFLCAGGLFVLGCATAAMAPSMPFILIGRFVQGLGGGWQLALVYVALVRLFPNHLMPRLAALLSGAWGASTFMGPLAGGLFATYGVWRLAYWAYALQALIFVILVWFAVPPDNKEDRDQPSTRVPGMRLLLLAAGVLLISMLGAEPDSLGAPLMAAAAVLLFGYAIAAAAAAVVANSLGFAEDVPAETLRTVAFWTFAGFVPVTLVGCWGAWRLSQPLSADATG